MSESREVVQTQLEKSPGIQYSFAEWKEREPYQLHCWHHSGGRQRRTKVRKSQKGGEERAGRPKEARTTVASGREGAKGKVEREGGRRNFIFSATANFS